MILCKYFTGFETGTTDLIDNRVQGSLLRYFLGDWRFLVANVCQVADCKKSSGNCCLSDSTISETTLLRKKEQHQ